MKSGVGRLLSWPLAFAILFIVIPPLLFHSHPSSLWAVSDYETLGLGNALNMAYRLADGRMYPAFGMSDHPGVPFYLMNWLALALSGYPVAYPGAGFFNAVIDHIGSYYVISIWLAALAGAAGVYIFVRAALSLVPVAVIAIGLLLWLTSTPATLLMFTSPSIESFAMLINGLFFQALVRLAHDRDHSVNVAVVSACVSALAYLNKLSYINVSLALAATGILSLVFRRAGWALGMRRSVLFTVISLAILLAVGYFLIGWNEFLAAVRFHKNIVFSSGLYGKGNEYVVSPADVWRAFAQIPRDGSYAMLIALGFGGILSVGGLFTARRGAEHLPVALICIGAGIASLLSAAFVLKHYEAHYTAGVSATLPACAAGIYLLAKSWGYRPRIAGAAVTIAAIWLMAYQAVPSLISQSAARTQTSQMAEADFEDINRQRADDKRGVAFLYKTPFSWYGEGFAIHTAGAPRLADDYVGSRPNLFSSSGPGLANRNVGFYVIDKNYFRTVESIKASPNLGLIDEPAVRFEDGDRIVELRTSFLLRRGKVSEQESR